MSDLNYDEVRYLYYIAVVILPVFLVFLFLLSALAFRAIKFLQENSITEELRSINYRLADISKSLRSVEGYIEMDMQYRDFGTKSERPRLYRAPRRKVGSEPSFDK